jgi:hypothetical protein
MMYRSAFFKRIEAVFAVVPLSESSDDDLLLALSVAQHATDMALVEAERRGLVGERGGIPFVPYELPDSVDPIETILTRGNAL